MIQTTIDGAEVAYREEIVARCKTVAERVLYVLDNYDYARNLSDFKFYWLYCEVWLGLHTGDRITDKMKIEMERQANYDTVNRTLEIIRRPEYLTVRELSAALMKAEPESPDWYRAREELKVFMNRSKYISNNPETVKHKILKQQGIVEYVLEGAD